LCEQPLQEQTTKKQVKISTKNNSGHIATKYLWTKLPNPYTWVKRQNNPQNTSSQTYTENLTKEASKTIISTINPNSSLLVGCKDSKQMKNYTKDTSTFVATTQGKYIAGLGGNCVNNVVNTVYTLPTNLSGVPILGKL
jgi:hypothetical protein